LQKPTKILKLSGTIWILKNLLNNIENFKKWLYHLPPNALF